MCSRTNCGRCDFIASLVQCGGQANHHHLEQVPLEHYFPEYSGGSDINKATKYILWKYIQANRERLRVYPQYVRHLPSFYLVRLCWHYGQFDTGDRYNKYSPGVRFRPTDNTAKCAQGLRDLIVIHSFFWVLFSLPFLISVEFCLVVIALVCLVSWVNSFVSSSFPIFLLFFLYACVLHWFSFETAIYGYHFTPPFLCLIVVVYWSASVGQSFHLWFT